MATSSINPRTRITYAGDQTKAKQLRGKALSCMGIVHEEMSFQNLTQHTRTWRYDDGVRIICTASFGDDQILIYVPEIPQENEIRKPKTITVFFEVVVGTPYPYSYYIRGDTEVFAADFNSVTGELLKWEHTGSGGWGFDYSMQEMPKCGFYFVAGSDPDDPITAGNYGTSDTFWYEDNSGTSVSLYGGSQNRWHGYFQGGVYQTGAKILDLPQYKWLAGIVQVNGIWVAIGTIKYGNSFDWYRWNAEDELWETFNQPLSLPNKTQNTSTPYWSQAFSFKFEEDGSATGISFVGRTQHARDGAYGKVHINIDTDGVLSLTSYTPSSTGHLDFQEHADTRDPNGSEEAWTECFGQRAWSTICNRTDGTQLGAIIGSCGNSYLHVDFCYSGVIYYKWNEAEQDTYWEADPGGWSFTVTPETEGLSASAGGNSLGGPDSFGNYFTVCTDVSWNYTNPNDPSESCSGTTPLCKDAGTSVDLAAYTTSYWYDRFDYWDREYENTNGDFAYKYSNAVTEYRACFDAGGTEYNAKTHLFSQQINTYPRFWVKTRTENKYRPLEAVTRTERIYSEGEDFIFGSGQCDLGTCGSMVMAQPTIDIWHDKGEYYYTKLTYPEDPDVYEDSERWYRQQLRDATGYFIVDMDPEYSACVEFKYHQYEDDYSDYGTPTVYTEDLRVTCTPQLRTIAGPEPLGKIDYTYYDAWGEGGIPAWEQNRGDVCWFNIFRFYPEEEWRTYPYEFGYNDSRLALSMESGTSQVLCAAGYMYRRDLIAYLDGRLYTLPKDVEDLLIASGGPWMKDGLDIAEWNQQNDGPPDLNNFQTGNIVKASNPDLQNGIQSFLNGFVNREDVIELIGVQDNELRVLGLSARGFNPNG